MSVPYTEGSILQFTPVTESTLARFKDKDGESWTEVVIGWAIRVRWVREDDDTSEQDMETGLTPVILDSDGWPYTVQDYLLDRDVVYTGIIRRV